MRRIIKSIMKSYLFVLFVLSTTTALAKSSSSEFINFVVSPDNQQIISIQTDSNNNTRELHVSDLATGSLIKKIPLPLLTNFSWFKPNLVITPDGKKVYIVDIDKKLYFINILNGSVEKIKKPKQDVGREASSTMTLTPDGKRLYIADGVAQMHSPAVIHILDTVTNKIIATVEGNKNWWSGVSALNVNLSHLYISRQLDYYNSEVSILDTRNQRFEKAEIKIHDHIESMEVNSVNGKLYVTGGDKVYIVDPTSFEVIDEVIPSNSDLRNFVSFVFAANSAKFYVLNKIGNLNEGVIAFNTANKKSKLIRLNSLLSNSEMRVSSDGSKIYVNHNNVIEIIDVDTDVIIRNLTIN